MTELRFDGRVALVTGSGRGIGRAHALLLASRGAKLVVNDVGVGMGGEPEAASPARQVVEEIRVAGGVAIADTSDVSTEAGSETMVRAAIDAFGRLDIVVHNAGIVTFIPFGKMSYSQYRQLVSVHQDGAFLIAKAAWRHMVAQNYGRFIFTVSGATMATLSHYASAKAALTGFARSLAKEGAPHNILANALSVMAYTRMMTGYFDPASGHVDIGLHGQDAIERWWRDNLRPEQVSAAMAWLAHDASGITGETIIAGGGHVARQYLASTEGFADVGLTLEHVEKNRDLVLGMTAPRDGSGADGMGDWMGKIVAGGAPPIPNPSPTASPSRLGSGTDL